MIENKNFISVNKNLILSQEVFDFINYSNELKINVFLIDRLLLFKMIDEKHRKLLIKRDLISKSMIEDLLIDQKYCISFGIFESDIQFIEVFYNLKEINFMKTNCIFKTIS